PSAAPSSAARMEQPGSEPLALVMRRPATRAALAARRAPREVIFAIDTSGSMHGASIEPARAALALALGRLSPADTFYVIYFDHRTSSLFATAQPADPPALEAAARYVAALRAQGGTEMLPALVRALDGLPGDGRLRQV